MSVSGFPRDDSPPRSRSLADHAMRIRTIAAALFVTACCAMRSAEAQSPNELLPLVPLPMSEQGPISEQGRLVPLPPVAPTDESVVPAVGNEASAPPGIFSVQPASAVELVPHMDAGVAETPPADPDAYPIDLPTAVHLAGSESLAVALAREQWREAQARVTAADALWLPSIRLGLNYNKHEGVIQDVRGTAFNTSRGAFYNGLGAGAVGAGSPSYPGIVANFHLADALAQPLVARQSASARSHATSAATNDALLEAALAYVELLARAQDTAVVTETLAHAKQLSELTGSFARNGEGTLADADRARTELGLREIEAARTAEAYDVARARLAQVLRLDPMLKLTPIETRIEPLELLDPTLPTAELVARGLSARPELAEQRHLVQAAVERLRRERLAPLVPSVLIGTSYGGFGAGLGGNINDYGDRFDFDAIAYWEVRNLSLGDRAARGVAQSQVKQTQIRQYAVLDQVAREVVEAHARVESRRKQLESARKVIGSAEESYRRNVERIHGGVGLPLESLQSLQALATVRREYVRTVADFNAAQFQLQRAMGYPVDGAVSSSGRQ